VRADKQLKCDLSLGEVVQKHKQVDERKPRLLVRHNELIASMIAVSYDHDCEDSVGVGFRGG
jgi:hypothetical protein